MPKEGEPIVLPLGHRDEDRAEPVTADDRFRLASVTKLYVAAVVLQLADEGVLSLDDPIGDYVDGVPNGDRITLRMLGRHTSGLTDAIRLKPFQQQIAAEPAKVWEPGEILDAVYAAGPVAEPGERFLYASTNTILLAEAVEAATGQSYREAIRKRILEPLDLTGTGWEAADGSVPSPAPRGYRYGKKDNPVGYGDQWFDATDWSASWSGAGGEMTGTAVDQARFLHALLAGDLISVAARDEMLQLRDLGRWGLLYGFHAGGMAGGTVVGHTGDVPGFSSAALYVPSRDMALVSLANLSAGLDKLTPAGELVEPLAKKVAANTTVANDASTNP
jgi:D-alanyl-D-alanine carboxypeptidase